MDSQSNRTVVPLSGPPSLLEPSDERLLADSWNACLFEHCWRSLRSFRLREVVIGRGLIGEDRRSRWRWDPTRP